LAEVIDANADLFVELESLNVGKPLSVSKSTRLRVSPSCMLSSPAPTPTPSAPLAGNSERYTLNSTPLPGLWILVALVSLLPLLAACSSIKYGYTLIMKRGGGCGGEMEVSGEK